MTFESEWARCSPWIDAALAHCGRTHDLTDVKGMVERREARFWAGRRAAMVTEVHQHPRLRALHLWLAGGDLDELVHELTPFAERWARDSQACERVTLLGRPGWERTLRPQGYSPVARLLMKDLTP